MTGAGQSPSVTVRPDPAALIAAMRERYDRVGSGAAARPTREALGLPTDRPVVMTGHQASWWHPGILAKFFACDALARCAAAAPAWIVPDQDEQGFDAVEVPVRGASGRLRAEPVRVTSPPAPGTPVAMLPAFDPFDMTPTEPPACGSVGPGLARMRRAIARHRREPNAARQIAGALADLMSPWLERAPTVFATDLARAPVSRSILRRLADDADRATALYNDAVAATEHAHTGVLSRDPARGRFELPLWRVRPGAPRVTVWSDEVADIPHDELAPKALLMTGILRLACADLFIHGTGGEAYDRATERWFEAWLGETLAPMLTVTATVRLPIASEAPTPGQVRAAVWRARHARHHPGDLGLSDLQAQRDALVRRIDQAPRASAARAAAFRELHDLLGGYRRSKRRELAEFDDRARALRERLGEAEIAHRRTWAFPIYDDAAIGALQRAVCEAACAEPVTP